MIARSRTPSGFSPATRITAMISSIVGGSGGYRRPLLLGHALGGSWTWPLATGVDRLDPAVGWIT
jgi:hypothetical protein